MRTCAVSSGSATPETCDDKPISLGSWRRCTQCRAYAIGRKANRPPLSRACRNQAGCRVNKRSTSTDMKAGKQKGHPEERPKRFFGAGRRNRTIDLLITSQAHYQLCYTGTCIIASAPFYQRRRIFQTLFVGNDLRFGGRPAGARSGREFCRWCHCLRGELARRGSLRFIRQKGGCA